MKKRLFSLLLILFILISLYGGMISLTYLNPLSNLDYSNYLEIYDNDNNLVFSQIKGKETTYISYDETSPNILLAFINLEDKRYNTHHGFDYLRIMKALYNNLASGDLKKEGGSSITQQVARTLFLDTSKSFKRKINEAIYTIKLENSFTKEEIIELYLNNIFFGGDIYGIEAASYYYFNKTNTQLTLSQAAFLAGLINSPNTYYNDKTNELAKNRHKVVLEVLYNNKVIEYEKYINSLNEDLNIVRKEKNNISNLNYYKDSVINELESLGYDVNTLLNEGIKVYTYLDNEIYENIDNIISLYQEELLDLELSIVVMKPYTNNILALIGGKNYENSSYNRALFSKRQVGSTIKPLLYYLALVNGFNPLTKLKSAKTIFHINDYGDYAPTNYGNAYPNRKITMLESIAISDNIYAVKTMLYLGSDLLKKAINQFADEEKNVPSLALGISEMTLLELTNMYNTFASLGKKYTPTFIKKIENFNGKVLYENKNTYESLLSYDHLIVLASSLLAPYDENAYYNIKPTMLNYQTNTRYATKTGSTKSDNYVIGYNQNYVIAVWSGNDEGKEITNSNISKKVFQQIANILANNETKGWYETGNDRVIKCRVDPISGELSSTGSLYYINVR